MKLFFREYLPGLSQDDTQSIIILHGLFGSSDNWMPQAKLLSDRYKIFTVDLRNHGNSPHDDTFDYISMVQDLEEFIRDQHIVNPVIIGHSMGGKAAMNFALAHPDKVEKLIVVDIAPKAYNLEHYTIAEGLVAIPIDKVASRNEADQMLSQYVPEADVRQFLLKNLQRKPQGGFSWKINLPVIKQNLGNVGVDLQFKGTFNKATLFIRGKKSKYVQDEDWSRITEIFPNAKLETMETGHWVQAEKPKEFVELVARWISTNK